MSIHIPRTRPRAESIEKTRRVRFPTISRDSPPDLDLDNQPSQLPSEPPSVQTPRHHRFLVHGCKYDSGVTVRLMAFGDPQITGAGATTSLRKRVDIRGNDLFLKHTASTLRKKLDPDFVLVMGDLISSQWISSPEFNQRADRFQDIFGSGPGQVYNLSGNHDIGYHGEMTQERVDRYRQRYGALNYIVDLAPGLRMVAINAMAVDGPPQDIYYDEVHQFIENLPFFDGETILLTHIPLYKPEGLCTDGPMFLYYPDGAVRDQNHLSEENSIKILNHVFGHERGGIILTGHDHEGCYTTHSFGKDSMHTLKGFGISGPQYIPEIVVRSLMGEFGGNGGLLSAVRDRGRYEFKFQLCRFQVQHVWWVTEIVTHVSIILACLRGLVWVYSGI